MKKKNIIATVVFIALVGACVATHNESANSESTNPETTANDSIVPTVGNNATESQWKYSEEKDEMTDKTAYFATVTSENSVDFGFPYDGGSKLIFTLRDSPKYGKDAILKIDKGQFNIKYNATKVSIRFDEDQPMTVSCNSASDSSMDVLFLTNYQKVVKRIKTAKTMKISAEFFQEARPHIYI